MLEGKGNDIENMLRKIIIRYSDYLLWWPYFSDKSEIVLSSILTQNTNWSNVVKSLKGIISYLGNAKLDGVCNLDETTLRMLIKPSGFYTSKARVILETCKLFEKMGGFLRVKNFFYSLMFSKSSLSGIRNEIDKFRSRLMTIKGIGKETADSILLYSFDLPSFVIDTYTIRLINRFFGESFSKSDYDKLKKLIEDVIINNLSDFLKLEKVIVKNSVKHSFEGIKEVRELLSSFPVSAKITNIFKVLHAGFVEIGKNICLKNTPKCSLCFLKKTCLKRINRC